MKNLYLLLFVSLFFVGCGSDDLEDLTTISNNLTLSETMDVEVPDGVTTFSAEESFDASQEDEFTRFGSKIDEVIIESIDYTILSVSNNPNDASIVNAQLKYNGSVIGDITNLNLAANVGSTKELGVDQSVVNAMAATFKSDGKVTVEAVAEMSDSPVDFELKLDFNLIIRGSVVN